MDSSFLTQFTQTLQYLIQPLALLWLGLFILTVTLWQARHRAFAGGAAVLFLLVQTVGGTNLSLLLLAALERPYAGVKAEELPQADVIVLLGGGVEPSPSEVGQLHLNIAGDRLVMALELARLGKAPVLCVSGGTAQLGQTRWVEADLIKQAIDTRQLASVPVISLGARRDTHDEAVRLRALCAEHGWKRILLVTSAAHQRRALATFRHEGLDVTPAACNFLTAMAPDAEPPVLGLPTHLGFQLMTTWLHEEIGWLEYRRRGWITAPR